MTGLFSMLDVITGMSLAELMKELPLSTSVERALLAEEGEFGKALACARAYERGAWHLVAFGKLPAHLIRAAYLEAVFWAEDTRGLVAA